MFRKTFLLLKSDVPSVTDSEPRTLFPTLTEFLYLERKRRI